MEESRDLGMQKRNAKTNEDMQERKEHKQESGRIVTDLINGKPRTTRSLERYRNKMHGETCMNSLVGEYCQKKNSSFFTRFLDSGL